MERNRIKKIGKILINVLLYLFLAICVFSVILTIISKKDMDGAAELFGYQLRVVTSESMAKCEQTDVSKYEIKSIPLRSMVFVKMMPENETEAVEWYRELEVGDVLTFRYVYTSQVTITHRITAISEKETGGFIIELTGDNKGSNMGQLYQTIDTSIPNNTNYVIGKVTGQSYLLGFIVSLLKSTIGIICMIIIPCFIIILLEVIKIAGIYDAERKKRAQEESDRKDSELEDLRRRLAQLESQKNNDSTKSEADEIKEEVTLKPESREEIAESKDADE